MRLVLALCLAFVIDVSPPPPAPQQSCIPRSECCKVCDRGQACGNSCISRDKTCRKGRGCACDASEICD